MVVATLYQELRTPTLLQRNESVPGRGDSCHAHEIILLYSWSGGGISHAVPVVLTLWEMSINWSTWIECFVGLGTESVHASS